MNALVLGALGWALLGCSAEVAAGPEVADEEALASLDDSSQALTSASTCATCALPAGGLYARFRVGTETFSQHVTTAGAINDVIALWRGQSNKRIPTGRLACGCTGWNCQWRFRIRPETLVMSFAAIELCDGTPSYVDANCPTFGGGSYCPWNAQLVELRDCRTLRSCPVVPR